MRTILLAVGAAAVAAVAAVPAEAQPIRTRVYVQPYPAGLDPDEIRDYRLDQVERRQEIEREALGMRQRVERRWIDPDED